MAKYSLTAEGPYNWINNARVLPIGSNLKTFDDFEPKSSKVLAKIPESGQDEVNRAVEAAKAAFQSWKEGKNEYPLNSVVFNSTSIRAFANGFLKMSQLPSPPSL